MITAIDTANLLVCSLADERFALPMSVVREVLRWRMPTAIPGAAPTLLGVIHHHGVVLPIIDVRLLLGLPVSPTTRSTRIIVVEHDGIHAGVLSDAVADIVEVERTEIEAVPSTLPAHQAQYLDGLFYWNERAVASLELGAVFAAVTAARNAG